MSNPGERDDAPEVELEAEIDEGLDTAGADEGGDDEVGDDSGEGDEHLSEGDSEREGTGEQHAAGEVTPPKPRSAATIAVQEAKRAAKAAREEAEAARRELQELRQAAQGRQTAEQQRLEAERIALMPPEEKYEYLREQDRRATQSELGAIRFQMQDAGDRVAFESMCARQPAFAAVREEVERQIADLRRSGGNTTRETLATYLIGKRAIENAGRAKAKQQKRGDANIQRNQGKPSSGSGSVPANRQRGGDEREQRRSRLQDIEI